MLINITFNLSCQMLRTKKVITDSCVTLIGGCQSEKSPYSARYEDGKLYYEGEWYEMCYFLYHYFITILQVRILY